MLLGTGMSVLRPWPLKIVIDDVLSGQPMPLGLARALAWLPGSAGRDALLGWCLGGMLLIALLGWTLNVAASQASIAFGQGMVYDLAGDLFAHLERLSLRFHGRHGVGDSIRRVTTDSSCVSKIVLNALLPVLASIVSLLAMFTVMWRLDRQLTLLALVVVPYMVFVFRRFADPMLERGFEHEQVESQLYDVTEQTLSSIKAVQAFGREDHADSRFRSISEKIVQAALATTGVQFRFGIGMGLATAGGTAAVLWVGATHVLDGRLTAGSILVFLSYLASLYGPLEALMYTTATIQGASGSARRVIEILETPCDVADAPGASPLPRVRGHVCLEHVDFGYEPDRPVLNDVSLEARPGQMIAIVGPTGAGKSTLVSLLPRFFDPWHGRVTIDGHDVRSWLLKSLRSQVALVPQEPFLFPVTIAQNIAFGRPSASCTEIEACARAANAHDFIERLPLGYDTLVGERGATLSGGERQRVSIARALLLDAPILVLDEPTSALDPQTERLLLDALDRLMADRTTLVIAHRLSTIRRRPDRRPARGTYRRVRHPSPASRFGRPLPQAASTPDGAG